MNLCYLEIDGKKVEQTMLIKEKSMVSIRFAGPILLVALLIVIPAWILHSAGQEQATVSNSAGNSWEDVIPITAGNIRGHRMLYNEGWFIVTSSAAALEYAKEKSIISSKDAIKVALERASKHTSDYKENLKSDIKGSIQSGKEIFEKGTGRSGETLKKTHKLAKKELAYSRDSFKKAWESLIKGNLTIVKRTEEDRKELVAVPGNYFRNLKKDFSNIWELTNEFNESIAGKIDDSWEAAFQKASREFRSEYEKSGEQENSLLALGPILYGYLKVFYHGLAAPASKKIVKTGVEGTSKILFLPVATTSVVAGRTIRSVGLTVYYTGKTGVKIISPTVEGGLLNGMSLLSLGSVPITYVTGGTLGAMNQVAFTAAAPVYTGVEAAATATKDTAGYVTFLAYDGIKGTARVVINQARSGIVLGYNALTAIPTHVLMGCVDSAVFLAWDGPRLVIAKAGGKPKREEGYERTEALCPGDIPVGTVVDLKKLEGFDGIEVEIISDDPAVIKDVIRKIPCDLRGEKQ